MLRVFIADESPMVCSRLITILSDIDGVSIVGYALNARQAEPVIRAAQPDVVLIGSHFPRRNSTALLHYTRAESRGSIVIMLTDQPEAVRGQYCEAGASLGFDKATDLPRLIEAISLMSGTTAPPEKAPETAGRNCAPEAGGVNPLTQINGKVHQ